MTQCSCLVWGDKNVVNDGETLWRLSHNLFFNFQTGKLSHFFSQNQDLFIDTFKLKAPIFSHHVKKLNRLFHQIIIIKYFGIVSVCHHDPLTYCKGWFEAWRSFKYFQSFIIREKFCLLSWVLTLQIFFQILFTSSIKSDPVSPNIIQ